MPQIILKARQMIKYLVITIFAAQKSMNFKIKIEKVSLENKNNEGSYFRYDKSR